MLRALLAERFEVTAHTEEQEFPVLALRIAKNGSNFLPVDTDYVELSGSRRRLSITADDAGPPVCECSRTSSDASSSTPAVRLFTALQEQLGLKLEAAKSPVIFLAIEHAERPSAN